MAERRNFELIDWYLLLAGEIWKMEVSGASLCCQGYGLPASAPLSLPRIGEFPVDQVDAVEQSIWLKRVAGQVRALSCEKLWGE